MVEAIVTAFTVYALIGVAFALLFVTTGIHRVDPGAEGSGAGFRLIVLPGVAALWPLLLMRWIRAGASS